MMTKNSVMNSDRDVPRVGSLEVWYPRVDSTMDVASRLAAAGAPHGTVVVAGMQTAGRGRAGRMWQTQGSGALLSSWILRLPGTKQPTTAISPLTALALVRAVHRLVPGAPVGFKWPNDVLIVEHKVAGILLTSRTGIHETVVIAGIGINVGCDSVPSGVTGATLASWGYDGTLGAVRNALAAELDSIMSEVGAVPALADLHIRELQSILVWKHELVDVHTGQRSITGRLAGLGQDGSLKLRLHGSEESVTIHVGEIVRGPRKVPEFAADRCRILS